MRGPDLSVSPAFGYTSLTLYNGPVLAQILGTAGTKPDAGYAEPFSRMTMFL